jgi:hypothetical protein
VISLVQQAPTSEKIKSGGTTMLYGRLMGMCGKVLVPDVASIMSILRDKGEIKVPYCQSVRRFGDARTKLGGDVMSSL